MSAHPGVVLRAGFLEPLGLTASALARGLGVHRSTVGRLLAGDQPLTPELAARLGAFFDVPARWFILMQAEHDAARVAEDPAVAEGVVPWSPDPDVLLTPRGVRRLDTPAEKEAGGVREVRYANGSVALVWEGP